MDWCKHIAPYSLAPGYLPIHHVHRNCLNFFNNFDAIIEIILEIIPDLALNQAPKVRHAALHMAPRLSKGGAL